MPSFFATLERHKKYSTIPYSIIPTQLSWADKGFFSKHPARIYSNLGYVYGINTDGNEHQTSNTKSV
jgi:hypothetical protein